MKKGDTVVCVDPFPRQGNIFSGLRFLKEDKEYIISRITKDSIKVEGIDFDFVINRFILAENYSIY